MFDFIFWVLFPFIYFFAWLYEADERPVAQRFTLGCAAIVAMIVAVILIFAYS